MVTKLSDMKNILERIFATVSRVGQVNNSPAISINNNNNINL